MFKIFRIPYQFDLNLEEALQERIEKFENENNCHHISVSALYDDISYEVPQYRLAKILVEFI